MTVNLYPTVIFEFSRSVETKWTK